MFPLIVRTAVSAILTVGFMLTPGLAQKASAARQFPDSTNGIFIFSDQLDTSSATERQFKFSATHYVGAQKLLPGVARHLRTYNPKFLVLHYRIGQGLGYRAPVSCQPKGDFIQIIDRSWVKEWPGDANVRTNWFFHWHGSARVYNCAFGWYLMELNDPAWRTWWSSQVIEQLIVNEDDGVFADSFSIPNYLNPYNPNLPIVDAAFEQAWARREFSFTDYMRGRLAGRWLWIPNIGSYITSRDPSDYSHVDGVMIEQFAAPGNGQYFALSDWQLQMNRVLRLVNLDRIVIAQSYPTAGNVNDRFFDLGTYLLIKGRHTYVNLLSYGLSIQWLPEYGMALGPPLDRVPANISTFWNAAWNVYVRHYSKGIVLVNPTQNDSGSINLGSTFYQAVPAGGGVVPPDGSAPGSLSYNAVSSLKVCSHCASVLLNRRP